MIYFNNLASCANCSRLNFSARSCNEISNTPKADFNFSSGQSDFKSLNIIFRRCEKARLTILTKAGRKFSGSNGCSRLSNTTQPESTSGSGKNEPGGILK